MAKKKDREKQMELLAELHHTMTDRQIATAIETTRERANDYRNGRIHMPDRYIVIIEELINK